MNIQILDFLKELKENNNREWFQNNKNKYEGAKEEFISIVDKILPALSSSVPGLSGLMSKDCIFRIYRDVRFSKDKSPYKTQMGAFFAPGGRKSEKAGYYLHLEHGGCFIAGGVYRLSKEYLYNIRSEIMYNTNEFLNIINDPEFVDLFGEITGTKLKRAPVGFPTDFEHIELLKFKDYSVIHRVPDSFFDSDNFIDNIIQVFLKMNPFIHFLNRSLD